MPTTIPRAAFIRQQYRIASPTGGEDAGIVAAYGNLAKRTTEPIPTYFESAADAQAICDARMDLLAQHNRLFKHTVSGVDTGLELDYTQTTPTATVIDDEGGINAAAMVSEISVNFENLTTTIETWGQA